MRPCPLRPTATAPPRRRCSATPSAPTSQRTAARFADRPALVSRHQDVRLTYAQLDAAVDAAAAGLLRVGIRAGDRVGIWAPNCAEWVVVQYATAKVGAILVNVNPAYRTHELEYVLRQSGVRLLFSASAFKTSDYAAMIDEVSRRRRHARAHGLRRPPGVGRVLRRRARPRRDRRAHGRAVLRRPDQHPVHERDDRLPQGRDALAPQHPQQRLLRHRAPRPHRARRDVPAGALLPLLRHGHGQPRDLRPRRLRRHPGARRSSRARPSRRSRREGVTSLYGVPDDVHRHARPRGLRLVRPQLAAHRDHGRVAVPDRGHEEGRRPHAHDRGGHLLRHDRDLAGLHADARRRPARAARGRPSGASARTWRSRSSTRRAAWSSSAASPASCARAATA